MLSETVESQFRVHDVHEEVQESVKVALGSKASTRGQVNLQCRFESEPDGGIHGR
jgi:hypothetical protein